LLQAKKGVVATNLDVAKDILLDGTESNTTDGIWKRA
jgi:hypothetical protein